MVLAIHSSGWFGVFKWTRYFTMYQWTAGGMRFLQWTDSPVVSVYRFINKFII